MSLKDLRAEYERLAAEVKTVKPGSVEHKTIMEQKRVAFGAWHSAKDQPDPDPAPIAEVPVAVEEIAPGTVIVTAEPVEEEPPCPPSLSPSTPEPDTKPKRARWSGRRKRSA